MSASAVAAPPRATTSAPARPRRGAELMLLVVALAVGIGAYALVSIRVVDSLPADFWAQVTGFVAVAVVAHLVLRFRAPYADQVILPVTLGLNGIGLAMIYRLDLASQKGLKPHDLAGRQLEWTAIAVLAALAVVWFLRDHRALRRYTYIAMLVGLGLVMLPLIPHVGRTINGAHIWVAIGPLSLQPAELAKIAFAIFFAGYLVTHQETLAVAGPKVLGLQLPRLRDLGPILVVWAVSIVVLVAETDLGTSLLFFGLFVAMLYIATQRVSWVFIGLVLMGVGAGFAATAFPHVQVRFQIWLHAFDTDVFNGSPGSGQLVRGLYGLANGGLFGTGWGNGYPSLVSYAFSDFIYTSLGEELGLTGMLAILLLYLILVQRGLRTAIGVRDGFGKLLAAGLAFTMAWQLFVVVGGVTRLIPLTGLTMPFVAQGGSSLLANWLVVGLLLRISDSARRPSAAPERGSVAPGGIHVAPEQDAADPGAARATDEPTVVVTRPTPPPAPPGPSDARHTTDDPPDESARSTVKRPPAPGEEDPRA
ncbi:FtsW/RodA/SpoVE family cell cycle protein [Luteimicrobium subarcticum]|uniref:Cell elongation-specific peptidoglycan biosynthesis regulator RodA n=1 Tax=Luteimicrobium subarcticum TaxID=620910 RepID=A0A2M8WJD8_9MICO|nr:FtsW/RodA/SpoVE family cell cycle protein [Luteimicrobium subarcticum]PJI91050.1 cell elongation-specific peptidoglycan biosynthesis regulator RodA [Luteimicrobium subarcticum]